MPALRRSQIRPHLAGDRNQCPGCLELFNSLTAFDAHRTGAFGRLATAGNYIPSTRRCLSEAEMVARGMSRNARGFWITRIRAAFEPRRYLDTTHAENAADSPLRTAAIGIVEPEQEST